MQQQHRQRNNSWPSWFLKDWPLWTSNALLGCLLSRVVYALPWEVEVLMAAVCLVLSRGIWYLLGD